MKLSLFGHRFSFLPTNLVEDVSAHRCKGRKFAHYYSVFLLPRALEQLRPSSLCYSYLLHFPVPCTLSSMKTGAILSKVPSSFDLKL